MIKSFITALLLSVFKFVAFTQSATVNNVPIDSIKTEYVQIVGTSKLFSTKINVELDFGKLNSLWKASDTFIKDKDGKLLTLNSMIDALNFMVSNGYEFVQAYAFSVNGGQNVYHYLMRKIKR
jgi:hypothetical protein